MSLTTELNRYVLDQAEIPQSLRGACTVQTGAIYTGCLAASVILAARPVVAQEALRNSLAGQAAADALRLRPESLPYTIKSGDFRLLISPALGIDWNDNVNATKINPEDDFIFRPAVGLDASYPISQRNLLQLNVNFGYQKYLNHDELSTWYVQSGSALSFDMLVKDFLINLHDRFSYVQDSSQEAAVANTGSYGTLNNTIGALVTWDLNDVTIDLGYDHQTIQSTTSQFQSQDQASELLVARGGLRVHPRVTVGVEGTGSFTRYDQMVLNDNDGYSAGIYADWHPDPYFHLQVRGGYAAYYFQQTSQSIQTSDLNTWYVGLTATHQISDGVSYSVSAGHGIRLGIQADAIEETYITPSINWSIIKNWTFVTSLSYQHGNQGVGNVTGNVTETYDWLAGNLGFSHAITAKLTGGVNYRLTLRSSNQPTQEYTQNLLQLQFTYRLE